MNEPTSPSCRILVVEDDPAHFQLIRECLTEAGRDGFEVWHAVDLASFTAQLARGPVDVVLLDLNLPDSEGIATLHWTAERVADAAIVLLTGQDDPDTSVQALEGGAHEFLTKDELDPDRLLRTIRYARRHHDQEKQLQDRNQRMEALLNSAGDAIITADGAGTIRQFNPAAEAMFGYTAEEILGQNLRRLMPEPHSSQHDDYMAHYERTREKKVIGMGRELEAVRKDGSLFPIELNVTDTGLTDPRLFVGIVRDISERKQAEAERIHFYSNFEPKTGLPQRAYTLTLLEAMVERCRGNDTGAGVLVLELGNLQRIRNGYGAETADSLLQEATTRLSDGLAAHPHILGLNQTDQFLLGLECMDSPSQRLPALVQHLLEQMQQTFETDGRQFDLYPRLGVAVFPDEGEDPHTLLRSAEAALTQVAEQQDSAYSFSDPHNQARMREQLELESDLRSALDNGEFFLVYQPQYRLSTGKMIGAEALLRWRHPERGVISPAQFIPLLEETGLIEEVGEWLLGEALRQGRVWHQAGWGDLHMAVNLSPRQIKSRQLLKQITTALERTGFPEDQLELEITESLLLENDSATQRTMQILQGMGIEVALDDFGTGYSALTYLHTFPLQTLKIDRAFVWTIGQSRQGEALLRGIVELGKALSMNIVAEGIENADHQTFLQQHSDLRGQGFGLGKPMSGEAVLQQLQEAHNEQPDPATAAGGHASH